MQLATRDIPIEILIASGYRIREISQSENDIVL